MSAVPPDIDRRAAGQFARQLVGHLSSAMTVTALELGARLGLLEALTATPRTVEDLADATGTQPRYCREWAELLVTAGVLVADEQAGTVELPADHAAALSLPTPYNLSGMVTIATATTRSLDLLERVFTEGGGIGYDEQLIDTDKLMHQLSGDRYDALLVDSYLAQVPGLTDRLSEGARVLEIGCGRGHAAMLIGRAFPASQVVGLDISETAVAAAVDAAAAAGLANTTFVRGDAVDPPAGPWDVVAALDVVHDLAHPHEALAAARRVIADDGRLVMIDSGAPPTLAERAELPWAPMMYGVSLGHCMTVSLAQQGEGLGTMWGREGVLAALADAGFGEVETFELKGDPMDLLYVARPA
ncbi:class I SAM-dependent methyltransferase [Euzebya sp.]|uniref:class I SAM-dependent methyltransferase n=1 Tax=Euzebya sp. TaxID=1971409 RepID=UPI0035189BAF